MSEFSFDADYTLGEPSHELFQKFELDPDTLERDELVILVRGLSHTVAVLREQATSQSEVVASLTERLELAETEIEENKKFDSKTSLLTARAFKNEVEETMLRKHSNVALRRRGDDTGAKNYLLFIDLDDFKRLNDLFNHDVVDQKILMPAVQKILEAVRESDEVGRHGGDEFLIFLHDLDDSSIRTISERILDHINSVEIPPYGPNPLLGSKLGASIGVAEYGIEDKYETVFARAHSAHKNSKLAGGKNQIHYYKNLAK